jgi:hypothetical protein
MSGLPPGLQFGQRPRVGRFLGLDEAFEGHVMK